MKVFDEYVSEVVSEDYTSFYPVTRDHLNVSDRPIKFIINIPDGCILNQGTCLYISGTLKKENGADFDATANIRLVDNFVACMFKSIRCSLFNKTLQELNYPGITSTVRKNIAYSSIDKNELISYGCGDVYPNRTFGYRIPLSHFGLGFFEDVNVPIVNGHIILEFIRDTDDNAIYKWKTIKADKTVDEASLPEDGKIIISDMRIDVTKRVYSENAKVSLVKQLISLKNIDYTFREWQTIAYTNLSSTSVHVDITNQYKNSTNPKFILISFHVNTINNQEKLYTNFSNYHVKTFYAKLGNIRIPDESFDAGVNTNSTLLYNMSLDFKKRYRKLYNPGSLYDPFVFSRTNFVGVLDTCVVPEPLSGAVDSINLFVEFSKALPAATRDNEGFTLYVTTVSDKRILHDLLANTWKED